MKKNKTKLSLGAVLYYWDKDTLFDFYKRISKTNIDIVYLGETVCAKRKTMRRDDWLMIADLLSDAGKEVVLSSMALIESNSELAALKTLCKNEKYMIEANDVSAIQLRKGQAFVSGTSINLYNSHSLNKLSEKGLHRWVLPLELSKENLIDMQKEKPDNIETEVCVYGRMPLAYSARCFTARAHNLPKDDCQFRCLDYPDGLLLSTQEKEKFLTLNGIQTLSAKTLNLITELDELEKLNVDVLRINPSHRNCEKVIDIFYQTLHHNHPVKQAQDELHALIPETDYCDGYWFGNSGMDYQNNKIPA